jgi:hypothetical protein
MTKRMIVFKKWTTGPGGSNINKITKLLITLAIPRTVGTKLQSPCRTNQLLKRFLKDFYEETVLTSFTRNIKS